MEFMRRTGVVSVVVGARDKVGTARPARVVWHQTAINPVQFKIITYTLFPLSLQVRTQLQLLSRSHPALNHLPPPLDSYNTYAPHGIFQTSWTEKSLVQAIDTTGTSTTTNVRDACV